jgi:hypothetical protein
MDATREEVIEALRISYQIGEIEPSSHLHKSYKPYSNRNKLPFTYLQFSL